MYHGNFDIYEMQLPFLKKAYLPEGPSGPKHEVIFHKILEYQQKKDNSGRFYLPSPAESDKEGMFDSPGVYDPMEEAGYDLLLNEITPTERLSFTPVELEKFADPDGTRPPHAPGVTVNVEMLEDHCGIKSASGSMKLKRVWDKSVNTSPPSEGGAAHEYTGHQELFELYFKFDVKFSGLYSRKGHGSGQNFRYAFWAVRARRDKDGKEVGLRVCSII